MGTTIPVAIIGLIAGLLAYHNDYDDGFVGRFSFGVIVMTATVMVLGTALGHYVYHLPLELDIMLWGLALFMTRHAWRFIQYQTKGRFAWNGQDRRAVAWDGSDRRSKA